VQARKADLLAEHARLLQQEARRVTQFEDAKRARDRKVRSLPSSSHCACV
jgi:hypothetical protein